MIDGRIKDEVSIRLTKRVRFPGDTDPAFWQADVWPDGKDYHAVGKTPHEALLELALFWEGRERTCEIPVANATQQG